MPQEILITTPEQLQQLMESLFDKYLAKQPGQPGSSPATEIIDGTELCSRLDINVNTLAIYRNKGKIPYLLIGNNVIRYDWQAVLAAITQSPNKK